MAALPGGTIPPLYRELYSLLCPDSKDRLDKAKWDLLANNSGLPSSTVSKIWSKADSAGNDWLTRDGFYLSLIYISLAQQGKPVEQRLLQHIEGSEYPIPSLGSIDVIRGQLLKRQPDSNPTTLGYMYTDITQLDSVTVNALPGKKGMVLKHVEYEVESKNFHIKIVRRYRDFDSLHDLLLLRYPYRLIPRISPKRLNPDDNFLTDREHSLGRFLNIVMRHPSLREDEAVKFFMTFQGKDISSSLRERYRARPDEYETHESKKTAGQYVDGDLRGRIDAMKREISVLDNVFTTVYSVAQNMANRSKAFAKDMEKMSKALKDLNKDGGGSRTWSVHVSDTWGQMKSRMSDVAQKITIISERSAQQSTREIYGFVEGIAYFLDLIRAFIDLFDRRDKQIVQKLQKLHSKQSSGEEVAILSGRNMFCYFVINLEAQLFHTQLEHLASTILEMVETQVTGHMELLSAWKEVLPILDKLPFSPGPASPI